MFMHQVSVLATSEFEVCRLMKLPMILMIATCS